MPTIESIKLRRGRPERFIVRLDDETEIVLAPETVLKFGVSPEKEFSDEAFFELLEEDAVRQAKDQAMRYLSLRPHSTFELTRKLKEKGYRQNIIELAIVDLQKVGLIDDDAFARLYLQNEIRLKPVGRGLLRQKLQQRGIQREKIDVLLAEYYDDQTETDAALNHARKFIKKNAHIDIKKLREKLLRYMQGKGFSWEMISKTEHLLPKAD